MNVSRRGFLSQTGRAALAAGMGATVLSSMQPGARAQTPERKIGFAFVGLGGFAMHQLLPAVAQTRHCRVAALVSGTPEKAGRLAEQYGVPSRSIYNYQNYEAIGENADVDVIYIVLPNGMHAEYTIRGARAGKHILCEKPMATSVAECQQMIDACRATGRKLMIGYRVRYEPVNQKAIELAQDGSIGRILTIGTDHGFTIRDPNAWRVNKKLAGGGALLDIGIYGLNAQRYLTGEEPIEVSAHTYQPADNPVFKEVEESCIWSLKFPSGALAKGMTSYSIRGANAIRVHGSEGTFDMTPATNYGGNRIHIHGRGGGRTLDIPEVSHFARTMDHMAECVINNTEPLTPGEEGLKDLRVIEAIYESANTGRTVRLDR